MSHPISTLEYGENENGLLPDIDTIEEALLKKEEETECHHMCSSNCRREGCNCECGEWHKLSE